MSIRADKPREYFAKLLDLPDDQIDYSEIPRSTASDWKDAEVLLPLSREEFGAVWEFIRARRANVPGRGRPAVPIDHSVMPDYLVCLEDGKKLKLLKRHLRSKYNMNPDQYREKWGLAPDYPMVAPKYAEDRSAAARKVGIGRGGRPRVRQPQE